MKQFKHQANGRLAQDECKDWETDETKQEKKEKKEKGNKNGKTKEEHGTTSNQ